MIWTGWNNSGASYGFSVEPSDFDSSWTTVTVELPTRSGVILVNANVAKKSFTRTAHT